MKSKGFVRPEIVVWTDGAYRNLSRDPEAQQIAYRVEITGTEALPDVVKTVITEAAEGANSRAWDSSCSWWGCSTTRPWPTAWPPQ